MAPGIDYRPQRAVKRKLLLRSSAELLFKDGKPVWLMHRRDIEPRDAYQIAQVLTDAFDKYCVKQPATA